MNTKELLETINGHDLDANLAMLNCTKDLQQVKKRYSDLVQKAQTAFGDQDFKMFSAPGRTEIAGNHTDHQKGRVLAAAVNMDIVAVACKSLDTVEFISEGFEIQQININDLDCKKSEFYSSEGLIRGILARFKQLGYQIGGFKCYANSQVLKGSGISSSAAFEVLVGTILNGLYNNLEINSVEIAKISQYAENNYFNKPSGLMDQMACSVGGFVGIDFYDLDNLKIEKINFDISKSGYHLVLVDTKGSHEDLSNEYGLMPQEMKLVANYFGKEVLSQISLTDLLNNFAQVRQTVKNDRALLRAIHFLNETQRVPAQIAALKANDIQGFLNRIIESGYSSYMYLQNVYSPTNITEQNLAIALAVSEQILKGHGAYRVHGGGLAGTIQAFVSDDKLSEYLQMMHSIFGDDACFVLDIRPVGGYQII